MASTAEKDLSDLRRRARSKKAAGDPDPDATQRRLHRERRARSWMDSEGAWNLNARGPLAGGLDLQHALDQLTHELSRRARANGSREGREAFTFDTLVELARRYANGSDSDLGRNPTASDPTDETSGGEASGNAGSDETADGETADGTSSDEVERGQPSGRERSKKVNLKNPVVVPTVVLEQRLPPHPPGI